MTTGEEGMSIFFPHPTLPCSAFRLRKQTQGELGSGCLLVQRVNGLQLWEGILGRELCFFYGYDIYSLNSFRPLLTTPPLPGGSET